MRCKACDNALTAVRDREVAPGLVLTEDLCPKCLRIALEAADEADDSELKLGEVLWILGVQAPPAPR
jgi:hypothetical protein